MTTVPPGSSSWKNHGAGRAVRPWDEVDEFCWRSKERDGDGKCAYGGDWPRCDFCVRQRLRELSELLWD